MRRAALTFTVLAALGIGGPALAPARVLAAPNPAEGLPLRALPPTCTLAPLSGACEMAVIAELDRARSATGLGPYLLPRDFTALSPDRQLLILVDLDRLAYGLEAVAGLDAELDWSALEGADGDFDPIPLAELAPGGGVQGFASNWAGGFANMLAAYYSWMYDDGYPSANLDCPSPGEAGCWGHRQNVLASFPPEPEAVLSLGTAAGQDGAGQPSYALLLVQSAQSTSYYYTWAQAIEDGAGREEAQAAPPAGETEIAPLPPSSEAGDLISVACTGLCLEALSQEPSSGAPAAAGAGAGTHIAASLAGQLLPPPGAASLTTLLSRGSCPQRFKSASAGVVSIRWYGPRSGRRDASPRRAPPVLLAAGHVRFAGPGKRTVRVHLTALGRRALRRKSTLHLTVLGTFTRAGAKPVSAARSFTLSR